MKVLDVKTLYEGRIARLKEASNGTTDLILAAQLDAEAFRHKVYLSRIKGFSLPDNCDLPKVIADDSDLRLTAEAFALFNATNEREVPSNG